MLSRTALGTIIAAVIALDRTTKIYVERNVSFWDTHVVIPDVFNIVHTQNRGAAFGILADAPDLVRGVVLIGLSLVVLVFIARQLWTCRETSMQVALALVLAGAAGNLYDRIVRGSVTDFLQVFLGSYEWPSFNVADSAICVGACLLALDLLRPRREPVKA